MKKTLALVLSAVMIISCLAGFVFSAYAADDDVAEAGTAEETEAVTAAPAEETTTGDDEPDDSEAQIVNLYVGDMGNNIWHWQVGAVWGQRINLGTNVLTAIGTGKFEVSQGVNSTTFKIWQWNGTYAATVAQTPLYTYTLENHPKWQAMEFEVPATLEITGDIYYEADCTSTDADWGCSPVYTTGFNPDGVKCYLNGQEWDGEPTHGGYKGIYMYAKVIGNGNLAAFETVTTATETDTVAETTGEDVTEVETEIVNLFAGENNGNGGNLYHWQVGKNFGQKFTVPTGNIMVGLHFSKMGAQPTDDTAGSFSIYQWMGDYDTTIAFEPLYSCDITDHRNDTPLNVAIPAGLAIEGTVYYEFNMINTTKFGFSPFCLPAGQSQAAGVENYCGGVLYNTKESSKGEGTIHSWISVQAGGTITEETTEAATEAATVAATEAATEAATVAATEAATEAATVAATEAATEVATVAGTEAATSAGTGAATTAAAKEEGCKSVVGSVAAIAMIAVAGTAVVLKKKND